MKKSTLILTTLTLLILFSSPSARGETTCYYPIAGGMDYTHRCTSCESIGYKLNYKETRGGCTDRECIVLYCVEQTCLTGGDGIECALCVSGMYPKDQQCHSCPFGAICDGANIIACPSGKLLSDDRKSCNSCPSNATCDGSSSFTCNSGYKKSGNTCVIDRTVSSCPSRMTLSSDGCCCINNK